jgi:D-sedoheptulose 7-phosphate isomerase
VRGGTDEGVCGIDDALEVMRLVGMVYDAALVTAPWQAGTHRHVDAISSYRARLGRMVTTAAWDRLDELSRLCLAAHDRGRTIWIAGNGGSAATAAHWATDLRHTFPGARGLRAVALGQNVSLITATANDRGYESVFTEEIRDMLHADDVVVVISASGNSPNTLNLLEYAAEHGARTVAVTGFDGGKAAKIAQLSVDAPSDMDDYGPVEDIHMALGHALCECVGELAAQRTDIGAVTA